MKIIRNKWFTYTDGLAHVTKHVTEEDTEFWKMEDSRGKHFEMSACGKINPFVYTVSRSHIPKCEICLAVHTMMELAD